MADRPKSETSKPDVEQNTPGAEMPEDLIASGPETDPVEKAYGRAGRQDTTGGLPADDPDAGEERRRLYKKGAKLVSEID